MIKFLLAACAAFAHGDVLSGPDWLHYTNKTWQTHKFGDGYEAFIWPGVGEGWHDPTLKPPPLLRFVVPAGSHFPPPKEPFWLDNEVFYVVTRGRASIKYANGTRQKLRRGDMFYSAAGIWQGPILNDAATTLTVLVLADFSPKFDNPPAIIPTNAADELRQVAYRPEDSAYTPYPGHECLSYQMFGKSKEHGIFQMDPGCEFPMQYLPYGSFYFVTHGRVNIAGDGESVQQFASGDARWSRPGWGYGPMLSKSKTKVKIMQLGGLPVLTPPPNKPTFVVRKKEVVEVAYTNTQHVGKGDSLVEKRNRPRRAHLRSKVNDADESVFLQYPSHQTEL